MTGAQKHNVQVMRRQGSTPTQIAETLGVSVNTVKSYCRRNNLSLTSEDTGNKEQCKQCAKKITQAEGHKRKLFCSDVCRYKWWNMRRRNAVRPSLSVRHCACCGKLFASYPSYNQKYCSHACYIHARFGKGVSV